LQHQKTIFGGGKILTRIAIHILVKKGELLIWRKKGHIPHCAMATTQQLQGNESATFHCFHTVVAMLLFTIKHYLVAYCKPSWIGDGFCDDINNNEGCYFDAGDCCQDNVNTSYCDECLCLEDTPIQSTPHNGKQGRCHTWA
jgi:hypothetical protein